MARYLYSELSTLVQARANCEQKMYIARDENAYQWHRKHGDLAEELVKDHLPSGGGYDSGTKLDWERSHAERLVFTTAFHHMNEGGYYDGWTEHEVIVTPSLSHDFHLRITGRNRNDIKEMMYQDFDYHLRKDVEWDVMEANWPVVKERKIEIHHRWIDQSRGEFYVSANSEEKFKGTSEECRSFAVRLAKGEVS